MDIEPTGLLPAATAAVTGAIRNAAELTGASFQYLLATAQVESRLNPQAAAPTSTARGPFQFIEQTWLATLKQEGPALGYGRYADAIAKQPNGRYEITDPELADPILSLRSDPKVSAAMAGAFAKANAAKLTAWIGRAPSEGELYLAHFMGASGAARLIGYVETQPQIAASEVFPSAAKTNPSIFYDKQNKPRSVAEVYRMLLGRYEAARKAPAVAPAVTAATTVAPVATVKSPAVAAIRPAAVAQPVQPAAAPTPAATSTAAKTYADVGRVAARQDNDAMPVFQTLFLTLDRPKPVAPMISELWGSPAAATPPASPAPAATPTAAATQPPPTPQPTPPVAKPQPVSTRNLFQDQPPQVGALFRGGA